MFKVVPGLVMSGNGAGSLSRATVADPYTLELPDPSVLITQKF
jgi:hypothetical protein